MEEGEVKRLRGGGEDEVDMMEQEREGGGDQGIRMYERVGQRAREQRREKNEEKRIYLGWDDTRRGHPVIDMSIQANELIKFQHFSDPTARHTAYKLLLLKLILNFPQIPQLVPPTSFTHSKQSGPSHFQTCSREQSHEPPDFNNLQTLMPIRSSFTDPLISPLYHAYPPSSKSSASTSPFQSSSPLTSSSRKSSSPNCSSIGR